MGIFSSSIVDFFFFFFIEMLRLRFLFLSLSSSFFDIFSNFSFSNFSAVLFSSINSILRCNASANFSLTYSPASRSCSNKNIIYKSPRHKSAEYCVKYHITKIIPKFLFSYLVPRRSMIRIPRVPRIYPAPFL